MVIAQINSRMPRTHGDGVIHVNNLDAVVAKDEDLPAMDAEEPSDVKHAYSAALFKTL